MEINKSLLDIIKREKNSVLDKEGLSPLLSLAKKIAEGDKNLEDKLVNDLQEFDYSKIDNIEISLLISFLYHAKISSLKFSKEIITFLKKRTNSTEEEILKNGLLKRFLADKSTEFLKLEDLIADTLFRKKHPWIWIDTIYHYSWSLAENEISKLICETDDFKNLLVRLPIFLKKLGKEQVLKSCIKWYPNFYSQAGRIALNKWANNFNVNLGLSINVEYRLKNVMFHQKPLINYA